MLGERIILIHLFLSFLKAGSSAARPLVADTRALTERALAARGLSAATSDANTDAQGESLLRHYRSQVLQAIRNRDENGAIAALDAIEDHFASILERQQRRLFLFIHFIIDPKRPITKILNM